MSPIHVFASTLVPFYLLHRRIPLYRLPIWLPASLVPVEPLLTWPQMSDNDAAKFQAGKVVAHWSGQTKTLKPRQCNRQVHVSAHVRVLKSDRRWWLLPDETSRQSNLMEGFSLEESLAVGLTYSHFDQTREAK